MKFFFFGKKMESRSPIEEHLDQMTLFSDLKPEQLVLIQSKSRVVEYKKGDEVYQKGNEPAAFYVILSGKFLLLDPEGDDQSENHY